MADKLQSSKTYEIKYAIGKIIRTTEQYWHYISTVKHADLAKKLQDVLLALKNADEGKKYGKKINSQ